jgi:hypothetical protein
MIKDRFRVLVEHVTILCMSPCRIHGQAGIALGAILFILAVLALLSAVIAVGVNGFSGSTTTPSASTLATTILQESDQVQSSVQLLMANGCSEAQLNFSSFGIPANASAPADGHCNVFDPRGANQIFVPIPTIACPTGASSCIWGPSDANAIPGIGTGVPQAIWMAYYLTPAICDQINAQLGRTSSLTSTPIAGVAYDGTFPTTATLTSAYSGITAACVAQGGGTLRIFYRVLWTR